MNLRALCRTLLNGCPDAGDLAAAEDFLRAALAEAARDEEARRGFPAPWAAPEADPPEDTESRRVFLRGLAPVLLLDGTWLARVAQPATAHRPAESLLFELYCRTMGLDDPTGSPPLRFRASLTAAGVHLPPPADPGFFEDARRPDGALKFSCLHLCLMHRPRRFFPELLGYTLAHSHREPAWWDAAPAADFAFDSEARSLALAALAAYPEQAAYAERIHDGWALYRSAYIALLRELGERVARPGTAEDAMAEMVQAKRPYALGYHARVRLEGRPLDQWLAEAEEDARPLLRALRESPAVDRACPAGSRLVRALDFGGPMFGVFDAAERRVCLDWIADPEMPAPSLPGPRDPRVPAEAPRNPAPEAVPAAPSKRELFTALLRAESPADCPTAAGDFIYGMLRRARWLGAIPGPARRRFAYSPAAFRHYVDALHRREVGRYRPLAGPPRIGRDLCRWAALQLAPAILVDGAWLAGTATAAESLGETGRHLLKIYADELGNGRPDWNHPNVYRRLLESLGLDLPAVDSEAFARNPEFLDSAFDIPVYLLAMGLSASRHLPELLGLNLAIEMSGLGAGYLRTVDLLRYHGLDPTIIQLHQSIDNLASGHAARAREAIVLHLDEARRRGEAVEAQWARIWTGYLSLNAAALGLAAAFFLRFCRERVGGTIRYRVPGP